jgi:hypothetical protein
VQLRKQRSALVDKYRKVFLSDKPLHGYANHTIIIVTYCCDHKLSTKKTHNLAFGTNRQMGSKYPALVPDLLNNKWMFKLSQLIGVLRKFNFCAFCAFLRLYQDWNLEF